MRVLLNSRKQRDILTLIQRHRTIDPNVLKANLKYEIKKSKLRVRYIAKEIGVSVHTVYSITKSKPTTYRIDFETLLKLCECLNIVVTDVFYDAWQINIFKADEPDLYVLIDDLFTDKNEAKKVALEVLKGYEGCDYELIGMTHEGEVN